MALDEAKNLAAIKSQFLANMSHEIRTPVTQSSAVQNRETPAQVIQPYSASAEDKGIELTAWPSSEIADVVIRGDEFRIEKVLNNLVSNAIKFTETGKVKVGLATNPPEDNRVLSICKSLLTLMDSTLDIASTPGAGTTMRFAIELPPVESEQILLDLSTGERQADLSLLTAGRSSDNLTLFAPMPQDLRLAAHGLSIFPRASAFSQARK